MLVVARRRTFYNLLWRAGWALWRILFDQLGPVLEELVELVPLDAVVRLWLRLFIPPVLVSCSKMFQASIEVVAYDVGVLCITKAPAFLNASNPRNFELRSLILGERSVPPR